MTVAAVILSATTEGALADTLGQPRARRIVDIAWSGGALPVVVCAPDPDGSVAQALVGAEATPAGTGPAEIGPVGQMVRGADLAFAEVRGTTGVLLWPARMAWVGPETVTSLIEAHGVDPTSVLRPAWDSVAGWPVLVPIGSLDSLRTLDPALPPDGVIDALAATIPVRTIDLGDPGAVIDVDTAYDALPPYEGPPDPPAGHTHEWGADVASQSGLAPIPGEPD